MPDIDLSIGLGTRELRVDSREAKRIIRGVERAQKKSTERITRIERQEAQKRLSMARRLSRKRASNRLKAIKARQKAEKAASRERIRLERREAKARERILKRQQAQRQRVFRGIGRVAGLGVAGVATGIGIGALFKAKDIVQFDEALARSSAQAKISVKRQMEIRDQLTKTGFAFGVQRETLLETLSVIVDLSGDIEFASRGMEKFSKIIRGTGADASELGRFAVALKAAFGDIPDEQLFKFMEILIAQGDKAKVNIAAMASEGEKLFGAFRGKGFQGEKSFREFGAFVQLAARSGDIAEGTTAVTRFLSSLIKQEKKLRSFGIRVFDDNDDIRDFGDILKDILRETGGDVKKLNKLFPNIRALKAVELLGIEYKRANGQIKEFNELTAVSGQNIERKFQRVSKTSSQAFGQLAALNTLLADQALVPVIDAISSAINDMLKDPQGIKDLTEMFRMMGEGLGAVARIGAKVLPKTPGAVAARFLGVDPFTGQRAIRNVRERRARRAEQTQSSTTRVFPGGQQSSFEEEIGNTSVSIKNEITLNTEAQIERIKNRVNTLRNPNRGGNNGG